MDKEDVIHIYNGILLSHKKKKNNSHLQQQRASQVAIGVKNVPANAEDVGDAGSIPGSGRSPGGGHGNHSSILAWRIPWTEELGGLQSTALLRVRHDRSN